MRKELLLLGAFGMLTTATLCAQEFHLQPTPQEYITQKDLLIFPDNTRSFPAIPCRTDLRCLYSVH